MLEFPNYLITNEYYLFHNYLIIILNGSKSPYLPVKQNIDKITFSCYFKLSLIIFLTFSIKGNNFYQSRYIIKTLHPFLKLITNNYLKKKFNKGIKRKSIVLYIPIASILKATLIMLCKKQR